MLPTDVRPTPLPRAPTLPGLLTAVLLVLASSEVGAQVECRPLQVGDTVRVTRTFWTLRPEYQLETRSQRIEFGRVSAMERDTLRYQSWGEARVVAWGDSVSVARHCRIPRTGEPGTGTLAGRGALIGGLAGLAWALCDPGNLTSAADDSDCRTHPRAGRILVGVAVGGGLGLLVGAVVAGVRSGGTEWGWIEGRGEAPGATGLILAPDPHAGGWRLGIRLPARSP